MGCSLSTGRESLQDGGGDNNTVQVSRQNPALGPRPALHSHSRLVIRHHSSHRDSRRLEYEMQRAQEQHGLQLDQRVTRPLMMHIWTSRPQLTREEVMRRREEYYDTRVTGRVEAWNTLRLAVEAMENGDLPTAQEIINAGGITIPTGNLIHGAYDELGTRYDLPEYCVSLPGNMVVAPLEAKEPAGIVNSAPGSEDGELRDLEAIEKRRREKGKQVLHGHGHFRTVIARLSDRGGPGTDVSVEFEQGEPLKYIIAEVMKKGNLGPKHRIRIAYLGKILLDHKSLPSQGWVEGHVINALVLQD